MADGYHETADVNEMFQKMAKKLGWFQDKQGMHSDQVSQSMTQHAVHRDILWFILNEGPL